ncbi:MAG TPA: SLC13 family permease [Streptosporangiaceae bacterium]|nr:SLC13 family permease [Streptosporangiaceae bacterium]
MSSPRRDVLRLVLWAAGIILAALAVGLRTHDFGPAIRATVGPFGTLAAIILGSALADRLGAFGVLTRAIVPSRGHRVTSAAAVLALTALLSAVVNLDVAVMVAMPVSLRAAWRQHLPAGRLAIAVAMTANAASFLLPTSNITNLLLLRRLSLPALTYVSQSWLPWLLVMTVTLAPLACWVGNASTGEAHPVTARPSLRALTDLMPTFLIASGVRTLLGAGLVLHGSFARQLGEGTALASMANNLPAAAAIVPDTRGAFWAAILATTIGPNLLITGSVATLICRRIAREGGARLSALRLSAIGLLLVPAQLAAATLGLHLAGALP